MNVLRAINKASAGMRGRINLMVGRAVLTAITTGKRQFAEIRILDGEVRSKIERVENFGFTSLPLPGSQAVVLSVGGNRDHSVLVAVDTPACRLEILESGEAAVYNADGDYIHVKRGGEIIIKASSKVIVDTPRMEVTGDLIDQTASGNSRTIQDMRDIFDSHTHDESIGSTTAVPNQQMGGA